MTDQNQTTECPRCGWLNEAGASCRHCGHGTDSIRCSSCGLVRLLEQPVGAPCGSCGGTLVDTCSDSSAIPGALFRWVPTASREALEVRMTREEFDAAVRAGEACGCERCLNCRARQYWREGGLYAEADLYPLDLEPWDGSPT